MLQNITGGTRLEMEGISRIDIEKAVQLLRDNLMFEVADRIEKMDIIPKLYVYTYFKKLKTEFDQLQGDGTKIDPENLQAFVDENSKLGLWMITDKTVSSIKKIQRVLNNGFERENAFCDFNDSKFHSKTMIGQCQCENHSDNVEHDDLSALTVEEKNEFWKMNNEHGWYTAYEKFESKLNSPDQILTPMYTSDEDIGKFTDDPEWWCKMCADGSDGEVGDVSCDME